MCFKISKGLEKPFKAEQDLYTIKWGSDIALGKRGDSYFATMYRNLVYFQGDIIFPDKGLTPKTCDELSYKGFHAEYKFRYCRPLSELILGIFRIPQNFAFYADEEGNIISSAIIYEKEFEESDLLNDEYGFKTGQENKWNFILNVPIAKLVKDRLNKKYFIFKK